MKAKGTNQKALAAGIKVSRAAVCGWIKHNKPPRQVHLLNAIAWLGLTEVEFYGPIPEPKKAAA